MNLALARDLNSPLQTNDDIERYLSVLSRLSPDYAAVITDAKKNGVVFAVGSRSSAARTTHAILNRESTYAEKVTILQGAKYAIFVLIHEIRHATPLATHRLSADFRSKSKAAATQELLEFFYKEEAYAIEAEIKLAEVLESQGFSVDFERVSPGALEVYRRGGVELLAQEFLRLKPKYQEVYPAMATAFVDLLHNGSAQDDLRWSSEGVAISKNGDTLTVEMHPGKLAEWVRAQIASLTGDEGEISLKTAVDKLKSLLSGLLPSNLQPSASGDSTDALSAIVPPLSAALSDATFEVRPEPADIKGRSTSVTDAAEATRHRVNITAKYLDLLNQSVAIKNEHSTGESYFHELLAQAEHTYGEASAAIYRNLYERLQGMVMPASVHQNDSNRKNLYKSLALSLLRSGYQTQGRAILTSFIHEAAPLDWETRIELIQALIPLKEDALISEIILAAQASLRTPWDSFATRLRKDYEENGTFTADGRVAADQFFRDHEAMGVTAEQAFDFMDKLIKSGGFSVHSRSKRFFTEVPYRKEKTYADWYYKLAPHAAKLMEIADGMESTKQHPDALIAKLREVALRAWDITIDSAKRIDRLIIEEWKDSTGVYPEPGQSITDYIRLLQSSNTNYPFLKYYQASQRNIIYRLLKNPHTRERGLRLLYSLRPSRMTLELYSFASEHIAPEFSLTDLIAFTESWRGVLSVSAREISEEGFQENIHLFNSRDDYRNQDKAVHAQNEREIHIYAHGQLDMAQMLLKSGYDSLQRQGIQIIEGLSERDENLFNPHEYTSPKDRLYGVWSGGSIYTNPTFRPLEFKVHALTQAARNFPLKTKEWLAHALELLERIKIEPSSSDNITWEQQEARIWTHLNLIEALVMNQDFAQAASVSNRLRASLSALEADARHRLEHYEKLTPAAKDKLNYVQRSELEKGPETVGFWLQYLDSVMKSDLAKALVKSGAVTEGKNIAQDMIESFEKDVTNRRSRFDAKAMIFSAETLANASELAALSMQGFQTILKKLAILRGDVDIFNNVILFFSKRVRSSQLSDEQKDILLTGLLTEMAPANDSDWSEMAKNALELVGMTDDIEKERKYPRTELEILKLYAKLAGKTSFERNGGFGNGTKLSFAKTLFTRIARGNPEILSPSNYDALSQLSADAAFQKSLAILLPAQAAASRGTRAIRSDGQIDLQQIQAGLYDASIICAKLEADLGGLILGEANNQEFLHLLEVYKEVVRQQIAGARNDLASHEILSLAKLKSLPAFKSLFATLETKLAEPHARFTENEKQVLMALFGAFDAEESEGKYEFYVSIMGSESAPLLAQKLAFEGFVMARSDQRYLTNHYQSQVREGTDERRRVFYLIIRRLLQHSWSLPDSRIMPYFFEDELETGAYLERYLQVENKSLVPEYVTRDDKQPKLDSYFKGTEAEFLARRNEVIQALPDTLWLPDLKSDIDILIAFISRFGNISPVIGEYLESIRQIYVDGSYDFRGPYDYKYTYSIDVLEKNIKRIVPEFTGFTHNQRNAIEYGFAKNKVDYYNDSRSPADLKAVLTIPSHRGRITYEYFQTEVIPGFYCEEAQRNMLFLVFNGAQRRSGSNVDGYLRAFGRPEMSEADRVNLEARLLRIQEKYIKYQKIVNQESFQIPEAFSLQSGLVKFGLIEYFKQLPFGERRAILDEFEASSKHLTAEQAVRRFFEVTGTEKIGQFLSTRRDLVPENYRREFEVFQQSIAASSFEEVRSTIEAELGSPLSEIFSNLNTAALNVGTIGEVYEGTLRSGEKVAVKVLTKSRRAAIKKMLNRLSTVAEAFHKNRSEFSASFDALSLFRQFKRTLMEELDFRKEVENAALLRTTLDEGLSVPLHYTQYTTESVLVQQFAKGVSPTSVNDPELLKKAVRRIGRHFLSNLLSTGIFHDDLHNGNFRIIHPSAEVELLDTGRIGRLTDAERENLVPLLTALQSKNADDVITHLMAAHRYNVSFDREELKKRIEVLMASAKNHFSLISDIFFAYGNAGLEVSPGYLQVIKGIMTFEGTAQILDPDFDLTEMM